jgi:hypothetical protein
VTAAGIAAMLAGGPAVLAVIPNLAFNSFIAIASLLASLRVAAGKADTPRSEVLPFLRLSALLFAFLSILGFSMVAGIVRESNALIPVGANGLFCLAWGVLLVVSALRRARPEGGRGAHPRFIADFPFSPREAEVIELLVLGLPNKVELVNMARGYDGPAPSSLT